MMLKQPLQHVFAQISETLSQLIDAEYIQPSKILSAATIGQHVRHIIELFQCLETGYEEGIINYEKRKRDHRIETDKLFAADLLKKIYRQLDKPNKEIILQAEDYCETAQIVNIPSNYYREIAYNLEHTIHHMALIRVGINEVSQVELPARIWCRLFNNKISPAMCTVSFIPVKDKFFLTSNRDEKNTRKKAIIPELVTYNGSNIIFPGDADHGGSWIGLKENGDMGVLLNGAFLCHLASPPYRKSRGIIFLDILATERPSIEFAKKDLKGIEPFTYILFEKKCLYELRWDGTERYCKQLAANRPHIWSSATLYDGIIARRREQWFAGFLNRHPNPTQADILNFHKFSGDGDERNDLIMNRDGAYATVSISSILLTSDRGSMKYLDINSGKQTEVKIELAGLTKLL